MKAQWYADRLPADKTMEEIEQDIVDSISTFIREKGFQFEDPHDMNIITEVVLDSFKNRQLSPFMSKKFNDNAREKSQWHINTVKEQLIAEHQKTMNSSAVEATSSEPTSPSGPMDMSEAERALSENEIDFMATQETVETGDRSKRPAETMRKNFDLRYPEEPGDLSHLSIDTQVFVTLQKMNLP